MRKIIISITLIVCSALSLVAQNNALILNGAYLVLNGGTQTSNLQLVINQSSTNGVVRNSGHIISESQYNYINWSAGAGIGSYVFPFGYSNTDYIPFTFTKTTTVSSSLKISTWTSSPDNTPWAGTSAVAAITDMTGNGGIDAINSVIDRWWDVNANSSTVADFVFSYRGVENTTTIAPLGTFQAQHWTGTEWASPVGSGAGVTSGIGTVSVSGTSDFTPWVLSTSQYALPVELLSFTASLEQQNISLYWKVLTTSGRDYFIIERSNNGYAFDSIGVVYAETLQNGAYNYSFTDYNTRSGKSFYRLKIINEDGLSTFSEIRSVATDQQMKMAVFPNPFEENLTLQVNDGTTKEIYINVQTLDGILIYSKQSSILNNSVETNFKEFAKGVYYLTVTYDGQHQVFKIVKL